MSYAVTMPLPWSAAACGSTDPAGPVSAASKPLSGGVALMTCTTRRPRCHRVPRTAWSPLYRASSSRVTDLAPDRSAQCLEDRLRRALALHLSAHQDRHPAAHIRHVVHDMRRENDGDVFADLGEQAKEAIAFFRIESGGRLVHDDETRVADERLCDPKPLSHAAGERREIAGTDVPQIRDLQQAIHHLAALTGRREAFQDREMLEHVARRGSRIHTELLRQISEDAAKGVFLADDVDAIEGDGALVRIDERRDGSHQRALAGTVRTEQAEHARRNLERHAVQGADAATVRLRDVVNAEHGSPTAWRLGRALNSPKEVTARIRRTTAPERRHATER